MPDLYLSETLPASTDFNFGAQSNVIVLECSACVVTVSTQSVQCRKVLQCILQSCSFTVSLQNVIVAYQRILLLTGIVYNITFDLIKFCVKVAPPIILETNIFSKPAQIQTIVRPKQSTIFEVPKINNSLVCD
jgi:hypothetical protein